jgi:hypothetical protein
MIHQELSGKSLYYPCYPFNPWFFLDFENRRFGIGKRIG